MPSSRARITSGTVDILIMSAPHIRNIDDSAFVEKRGPSMVIIVPFSLKDNPNFLAEAMNTFLKFSQKGFDMGMWTTLSSKKVNARCFVLSINWSGKIKSPGFTYSLKDPHAVVAIIWVQPCSCNAQIFARKGTCVGIIEWFFPCLDKNTTSTPCILPRVKGEDGFPYGVSTSISSYASRSLGSSRPEPPI